MKRIFLYGLANAEKQYQVVRYSYIEPDFISIENIMGQAAWLALKNPDVEHVYACDERYGLATEYRYTVRKNTMESNIAFKDMLERMAIMII